MAKPHTILGEMHCRPRHSPQGGAEADPHKQGDRQRLAELAGDMPVCPGPECHMCSGEYCSVHMNEPCDCDVLARHGME